MFCAKIKPLDMGNTHIKLLNYMCIYVHCHAEKVNFSTFYTHTHIIFRGFTYTSVTRLFEYAMQKAAYRFFWTEFSGEPLTIQQLRRSFGDLFIGRRSKKKTLTINTDNHRDVMAMHEQHGVNCINKFYKRFVDDTGIPIIINTDYELVTGDVLLKGTLPVIREYNDEIELLDVRSDNTFFKRNTEWLIINHDIELIAAGLAFKQIFQTDIKTFKVYMLTSGKIHTIQKDLTALERFYTTVNSVGKAILNGIYFPSYNYNCLNCAYYKKCIVT